MTQVIENPSDFDGSVNFGSFVLVTVDVEASLQGVTDQAAIDAARALPSAKCLAWVRTYTTQLGSPLFHVIFLLVGRGLPETQSFAAVPIAPAPPHPDTGRAAVEPSRPFPWADCYIYTLRTLTAPISRLYQSAEPGISLDETQKRPVLLSCFADARAATQARRAAAVESGYAPRPGIRIRDHGSHGSVIEGDSTTGSEASSESSASGDDEAAGAAPDAVADGSGSSNASSSSHSSAGEEHRAPEPEEYVEEKGVALHVEVSGVFDASDEFGTVDEFLSVVARLAEIEAERAEREVTTRLARAVAPKTAAWLQGISAAGQLDETHEDAPDSPSPQDETPAVVAEPDPAPRREDGAQPHSPIRSADADPSREHELAQDPVAAPPSSSPINSPSIDAPSRPSTPQRPTDGPVAASLPEHAALALPSPEAAKDLEAGDTLPRDTIPPTESNKAGAGGPSQSGRRTLRALLSLLFYPFRLLMARFRALL